MEMQCHVLAPTPTGLQKRHVELNEALPIFAGLALRKGSEEEILRLFDFGERGHIDHEADFDES